MLILSILVLIAWLYLWACHGRFWEAKVPEMSPKPKQWPRVAVVIPARNEEETIGDVVNGILGQDYPGELSLVVVDDHSTDKTAELAYHAARLKSKEAHFTLLKGRPLPEGWAGKVWAMQQGWEEASKAGPDFIWFTDADIWHDPQALRGLVSKALHEDRALTSAMVELRCEGFWEKALVPAFVYFFKLLYPFRWVNDPNHKCAGAAGGSMLERQSILEKIKGPSAIKGALIDDCALAKAIQDAGGKLRLDMTRDSRSLRGYPKADDAWNTIARTAYTQLNYNPVTLIGSVLGLGLLFVWPLLGIKFGSELSRELCIAVLVLQLFSFLPNVRFYRLNPLWTLALPLITLFYLGATLDSARRYYAGSGGRWKGRTAEKTP